MDFPRTATIYFLKSKSTEKLLRKSIIGKHYDSVLGLKHEFCKTEICFRIVPVAG